MIIMVYNFNKKVPFCSWRCRRPLRARASRSCPRSFGCRWCLSLWWRTGPTFCCSGNARRWCSFGNWRWRTPCRRLGSPGLSCSRVSRTWRTWCSGREGVWPCDGCSEPSSNWKGLRIRSKSRFPHHFFSCFPSWWTSCRGSRGGRAPQRKSVFSPLLVINR